MTELSLAQDFGTQTREQWLALVAKALKGADFDKALVSKTYDDIRVEPLYARAAAATERPLVARTGRWRIAQRVDHPEPKRAAEFANADLEGGADALVLVFAGHEGARGFGLTADPVDALDAALNGVMLDLIQIRIDAGVHGAQAAGLVAALAAKRGHDPSTLDIDFAIDEIGAFARSGELRAVPGQDRAGSYHALRGAGFAGPFYAADGRPYHEAGASEAQELAAVIATGLAQLRDLDAGGVALDDARAALSFLLVADADVAMTIAKFRALRRLWSRVEAACGLAPEPIRIHAETAWRSMTRRDPHVNMLRATTAVFASGVGGADTINVLPFNSALGLADGFARRMARNLQLILLEESGLGQVADPAAGAGGAEALTQALCEKAWALFQDIERDGGMIAALMKGLVQAKIAKVRAARSAAIAKGRDALTGTTEFPSLKDVAANVLPVAKPAAPKSTIAAAAPPRQTCTPLPSQRLAEPFEQLRDASDAILAKTGKRPRVLLANLGTIPDFNARATFARNFFATGGIEAVGEDGFTNSADVGAALAASGARLACLCSSDTVYGKLAEATAMALVNAGAAHVYLAGRGAKQAAALKAAGIGTFIYTGCDMLALLESAYGILSAAAKSPN